MNKTIYLLTLGVLIFSLSFTGCGDDDSDDPSLVDEQTNALIGAFAKPDFWFKSRLSKFKNRSLLRVNEDF